MLNGTTDALFKKLVYERRYFDGICRAVLNPFKRGVR
jgi:hypothetical protein